jgi:hypothetical protein
MQQALLMHGQAGNAGCATLPVEPQARQRLLAVLSLKVQEPQHYNKTGWPGH